MVDAGGTGYELGDFYTKSEADAIFARKDELDLKVLETYYNLRRTGKVYQAKVWKFAAIPHQPAKNWLIMPGLSARRPQAPPRDGMIMPISRSLIGDIATTSERMTAHLSPRRLRGWKVTKRAERWMLVLCT